MSLKKISEEAKEIQEAFIKLPKSTQRKCLEFMRSMGFVNFHDINPELRKSLKKVFERFSGMKDECKSIKRKKSTSLTENQIKRFGG